MSLPSQVFTFSAISFESGVWSVEFASADGTGEIERGAIVEVLSSTRARVRMFAKSSEGASRGRELLLCVDVREVNSSSVRRFVHVVSPQVYSLFNALLPVDPASPHSASSSSSSSSSSSMVPQVAHDSVYFCYRSLSLQRLTAFDSTIMSASCVAREVMLQCARIKLRASGVSKLHVGRLEWNRIPGAPPNAKDEDGEDINAEGTFDVTE
jgi:hypothetical protein